MCKGVDSVRGVRRAIQRKGLTKYKERGANGQQGQGKGRGGEGRGRWMEGWDTL